MKKVFFSIGFCVIFLSALVLPLETLLTCCPSENGNLLDYIWYVFLIICSISYSVTLGFMYVNYEDMKNSLINIINLNKKNDKDLSIIINSSTEIVDKLIL